MVDDWDRGVFSWANEPILGVRYHDMACVCREGKISLFQCRCKKRRLSQPLCFPQGPQDQQHIKVAWENSKRLMWASENRKQSIELRCASFVFLGRATKHSFHCLQIWS